MTDKKDRPAPARPEKSTFRGFLPDEDPIYDSGWRFIMGKQLNSHLKPKKEDE